MQEWRARVCRSGQQAVSLKDSDSYYHACVLSSNVSTPTDRAGDSFRMPFVYVALSSDVSKGFESAGRAYRLLLPTASGEWPELSVRPSHFDPFGTVGPK